MREVTIGQKTIKVRGLTGEEIAELKADKLPFGRLGMNLIELRVDMDLADRSVEAAFEMIIGKEEMDILAGLPNTETVKVWDAILKETYNAKDEEKNS